MSQKSAGKRPASQDMQAFALNATRELRETINRAVGGVFAEFAKALPLTLTEAIRKIGGAADARALQELARDIPKKSDAWSRSFIDQIARQLIRSGADVDDEGPESSNAQAISRAQALLVAESQYHKPITEIVARVNLIRLMVELPVHAKALAPTGLYRALQETTQVVGWPRNQEKALFEAFDSVFIPKLDKIYTPVLATLKKVGAGASRFVADIEAEESADIEAPSAPEPRRPEERLQPPKDQSVVDAKTSGMLRDLALNDEGEGYTDGLLAADLLALMDHRPLPGISHDKSFVPVQRISVAGHFLNEVTGDPIVAPNVTNDHESIRMPLMKSALADSSVFTAVSHPLRSLIDELMLKSATMRLTDSVESKRLNDVLHEVVEQFNLAPDFVRDAMGTSEPLDQSQIDRFFELQRRQAQERKQFVLNEAKRMVALEIERSTFGRDVPPPGLRFLSKPWSALLTKRLLQHSADHPLWKEGIAQADLLIDLLEDRNANEAPPEEWTDLVSAMCDALESAGLPSDQRKKVVALLEAARRAE